jgi:hypothetical protein
MSDQFNVSDATALWRRGGDVILQPELAFAGA